MTIQPASRTAVLWAVTLDVLGVAVFAVAGRLSHTESLSVPGVAATAWPFLAALALGWLVTRAWRAPTGILRTGIGVWASTVVVGMLLRLVTGEGVQLAFVIVAAGVLGALLLGWRAAAGLASRTAGEKRERNRGTAASAEGLAHSSIEHAWDVAVPLSPHGFFPRYGPLPAVTGVAGQSGEWDAVGNNRTLLLSDGGSVVERIVSYNKPDYFAYDSSEFQKLFGRLVSGSRSEWIFSSEQGGTRILWTYRFHPRPGADWIVTGVVRLLWAPYMRRVLPGIIAEVERTAA